MTHDQHSDPSASGGAATRAAQEEQPTARSGPSSPESATYARAAATAPRDTRSGLTEREQSDRWPLG